MSLSDELFRSLYGSNPTPPTPQPQWGFKAAPKPQAIPIRFAPQPPLVKIAKRKVFISYHHIDQAYIDAFRKSFGSIYDVFTDCSLDEAVESTDLNYVNRTIAENFITGTSITIVICGNETWRRKCVDWEIYSTLYKNHALLGIMLPTVQPIWSNGQQVRRIPDRLFTNYTTGYANIVEWPQTPQELAQAISASINRSTQFKLAKNNSAPKMGRNI